MREDVLTVFADLMSTSAAYQALCLTMSRKYLAAIAGWKDLVLPAVSVTVVQGPQGMMLSNLKRWLWEQKVDTYVDENTRQTSSHRTREPRGVACLKGLELRATPEQIFAQAQANLASDSLGADRFREWYVEVDGRHVSPKWLVSKLADLPVSEFTSGEARRVLRQLGIIVKRVGPKQ